MNDTDLTRLFAEFAHPLYAFLCYRTGDQILAEDLLGDTFERAVRARRSFDRRKASERTWLYAIALNCVRDTARRAAAETRALARVGASLDSIAPFELMDRRAALHEAVGSLPVDEREAVALRYGADLKLADVAQVLGEPRGTAEARIYRGLKHLRETLGTDF